MTGAAVLLHGVPWSTYVVLRDTVPSAAVRMTYLRGSLEVRRTTRLQETSKTQIARLLELFCLERGIALYGYGSRVRPATSCTVQCEIPSA